MHIFKNVIFMYMQITILSKIGQRHLKMATEFRLMELSNGRIIFGGSHILNISNLTG